MKKMNSDLVGAILFYVGFIAWILLGFYYRYDTFSVAFSVFYTVLCFLNASLYLRDYIRSLK